MIPGIELFKIEAKKWKDMNAKQIFGHSPVKAADEFTVPEEPYWNPDDLEFFIPRVDFSACTASDKSKFVADIIENTDKSDLVSWDITRKLIKDHVGINMGTLDTLTKKSSDNDDSRTHADLATDFIADMLPSDPAAIGCEGGLYGYHDATGLWERKELPSIEMDIGRAFSGKYCKRGSDYKGVAKLIYNELDQPDFFNSQPYGVACENSFFAIETGTLVEKIYSSELRQRKKLPYDPSPLNCPMFVKYLLESFAGEGQAEQIKLLQEIMGAIITGSFHRIQKAVLLFGGGDNGKSVLLELLENFIPIHLRCSINPSKFNEDYFRAILAGKIVNIIGELEQTKALPSASFKDIIGCDTEVTARLPHGIPFSFTPRAAHIFASNHFPQTKDHSHGFYRRWVVLDFQNEVAEANKVPHFGALIAEKESPQVLYWAMEGARRLLANNFKLSLTTNHKRLMNDWKVKKDSVYAFIYDDEVVTHAPMVRIQKKEFYIAYGNYCRDTGARAVGRNTFYERCETLLDATVYNGVRCYRGVTLVSLRTLGLASFTPPSYTPPPPPPK